MCPERVSGFPSKPLDPCSAVPVAGTFLFLEQRFLDSQNLGSFSVTKGFVVIVSRPLPSHDGDSPPVGLSGGDDPV